MLVVDILHWLDKHGNPPDDDLRLRRRVLRIARFIEGGGPLKKREARETLVECSKRPGRKPCLGLMWVTKTADDRVLAWCPVCKTDEAVVSNWRETIWADGPMEPLPPDDPVTVH